MVDLKKQIQEKEKELTELKKDLLDFENLSADKKLATELHGLLCTFNHVDGCSWYYTANDGDWDGYARRRFLERAQAALQVEPDLKRIIAIVKAAMGNSIKSGN